MCMVLKNSSGELESQSATTRGAFKLSKNEVDQSQPMNENSISSMSVMWILLYVAFCTIIEISRQKEARNREYALLLSNDFKELIYSVQYHKHHSRLLNSLEHCIWTTPMTNIRPGRDSNPVPLSFAPQSDWVSHRGRPAFLLYHQPSGLNGNFLYNICTMLVQRRRRCINAMQMFCVCWELPLKSSCTFKFQITFISIIHCLPPNFFSHCPIIRWPHIPSAPSKVVACTRLLSDYVNVLFVWRVTIMFIHQ